MNMLNDEEGKGVLGMLRKYKKVTSWSFYNLFLLFLFLCSESLYEDEDFEQRQLAALVVSKVALCT